MRSLLVVDDSGVVRMMVRRWLLEACRDLEVVEASGGRAALELLEQRTVDLILLDVEMPDLDGLSVVRTLRVRGVRTPVVMFSTLTSRGTDVAVAALLAGASDVIAKPQASNQGAGRQALVERVCSLLAAEEELIVAAATQGVPASARVVEPATPRVGAGAPRIAHRVPWQAPAMRTSPTPRRQEVPTHRAAPPLTVLRPRRPQAPGLVVVASSTGGPQALASFLAGLGRVAVPTVCVQHMPASFLPLLAARLAEQLGSDVALAEDGEVARAGTVRLAAGGRHLIVTADRPDGSLRLGYVDQPPENSCRPSADVLFRSAAATGVRAMAVVLTGMGADGAKGAAAVAEAGGVVAIQDAASAVVWGMPGAVDALGVASVVAPPAELGDRVRRLVGMP
ncbi:response regulator receiver modulated CheB methylesterase [Acidimicrobium ferrooxidans DSM 10331]|uniref:protein-glutamate methylesterase n=1 Tax=Acidimicrobium ferrooxidans (strain DSM 10331 / JCM 15462 / NBRC 103882 / ICP) TaxID=525909 RepID=C7M285_ACIFD|nr:chemotaxis protein CheB [Acidimicrobium ferrooxidans]ACU53183.1 response regulator receiver modulated CheB methylesterase [Acidimicrobium ferrooxidans DSM 10331]